ncbi:RNA ligase partner protein, partial [Endothiovibrio diazotrophicus]
MQRFILDTSLFTNPDVHKQFSTDPMEAIAEFIRRARRTHAEFYMPGSVYEELRKMRNLGELAAEFQSVVKLRSPRRYALMVPSELVYELIEELRSRVDKGLRIAEELTKMAYAGGSAGAEGDGGRLIARLRDRYREALRQGVIDSKEDVDVLLLAYEMDATLVSGDEGLCKWADKVGISLIESRHLRRIMETLEREPEQEEGQPPPPAGEAN